MKKDNKIYFWACDYCNISGEGILAKLFIKEYLKKKTTSVFVNVAKNNKFYVQAGAGIVADSKPLKEYEETVNKAKALLNSLK